MEYILVIVLILWAISSYLYRTSKFKPDYEDSLKALQEELAYKKSLLIRGVKIEQPKVVKSKPKPKFKFTYSDSTPEVEPIKQLMFVSAKDKLEYMQSEKWKQLKLERLRIAQHKCESCGSTHNLHLHHITYERLTQELIEDVVILCNGCHTHIHSILGYDRTTLYPISIIKDRTCVNYVTQQISPQQL